MLNFARKIFWLQLNEIGNIVKYHYQRLETTHYYLFSLKGKTNLKVVFDIMLLSIYNRSEVGTIFSLSWLITWFGHVLNDLRHIVRCYDFFIACHPLMPIYLAAAVSIVCFFVLRLNVPVNNFSVMSERSHSFLGITSTFRGVNVSLLKETTLRW